MSGFDLVPVDGGDPIHLPPGQTVLGRGPFLGVSDKRVSRNHGLLENLDGQLRLKPTHLNPCFIQSSLTDDPQPLTKGSWYPLHHGDLFSLLPGQFIYKVVDVGEEDRTPRNSQMFAEEDLPVSPRPDVEPPPSPPPPLIGRDQEQQPPPQEEPEPAARSNPEEAESPGSSSNQVDLAPPTQVRKAHGGAAPPVQRRRVLPAWMMSSSPSSSSKVQLPVKKRKAPSSKPAAATPSTPALTSSPGEAELSVEEQPKKRRKKSDEEEKVQTVVPVRQPRAEPKRSEVSDESDGFTMEVDEEGGGGQTSTADRDTRSSSVSQPEEDRKLKNGGRTNGSSAPSKPRLRTPCPYGKDCYRKNPLHFQECSHPGDTDYEEEEEEDEEELPECPYGTDCYRKNPLHRKEYKHTKKPASTTQTRPKKPATRDEDEDEDEYEDSFIDDDSLEEEEEEGGDDSDYVPPASDDSEKEDIRALQREAQDFLKKRS